MANLTVTEGAGTQLSASQYGTVKTQLVGLLLGAMDGVLTMLGIGQQLSAASLPVVLASDHSIIGVTEKGGGIAAVNKATVSADATTTKMDLSAAPGSGKIVACTSLVICAAADMTVTLTEESGSTSLGTFYVKANVPLVIPYGVQAPLKTATTNKKLQAGASVVANLSIQAICFPA